jgi:microcystin-dependent protein
MPIVINDEKIIGEIIASTATSTPIGYLNCNGAAISRTAFVSLFTIIGTTYGSGDGSTTFNLPDLRGQFLRGLDGGRGIDTDRSLGSSQAAQNLSHSHTVNSHNHGGGSHNHNFFVNYTGSPTGGSPDAPTWWGNSGVGYNNWGTTGGSNATVVSSESPGTNSNGGGDLRPVNVAVNYFIKY